MRILLVGNYEPDQQQSMQRYGQWLLKSLRARGATVVLIRPFSFFSRLAVGSLRRAAVIKYLGYLDKYWIFPSQLRKAARSFDLVHILDHSNSMYLGATAGVPTAITCHDVLAIRAARGEFTATRTGWSGRLLQSWILRGLRRARNVICVSEKTAQDLTRLAGWQSDSIGPAYRSGARIVVILNPLNWGYKPQAGLPDPLRERLGLEADQPYFLHVGGNQWYKNRPGVVRIFRELATLEPFTSTRLIMAGKPLPSDLQALVDRNGLASRVIAATGTSNEELEALYSNALALLFPSLEEGFGWPIAEAQACGCPVVTSGRAPMTEVAGGAAILIDPEDPGGPAAVAQAIRSGLGRKLEQREVLRSAGFQNVARFEEGKIAAEYCDFYFSILGGSK